MENPKLLYIADDDDNIRKAIQLFLENEGYIVKAFETGDLLFAQFLQKKCDLVILDIMMPGSSGFDICSKIREISTVPIIMLTAKDTDMDYAMGLTLGSDDYFTKPFSAVALVMRVKAIFRRIEFESQKIILKKDAEDIKIGNISIHQKRKQVFCNEEEISLTPNEYNLFLYLSEHNSEAVSREELLKNVWGYESAVETRATDDTIRRLRKKIKKSNLTIEAVWGFGFRLKENE